MTNADLDNIFRARNEKIKEYIDNHTTSIPYADRGDEGITFPLNDLPVNQDMNGITANFKDMIDLVNSLVGPDRGEIEIVFSNFLLDFVIWDTAGPDQGTQIYAMRIGVGGYNYKIYDSTLGGFTNEDYENDDLIYNHDTGELRFKRGTYTESRFVDIATDNIDKFKTEFMFRFRFIPPTDGIIKGKSNTLVISEGEIEAPYAHYYTTGEELDGIIKGQSNSINVQFGRLEVPLANGSYRKIPINNTHINPPDMRLGYMGLKDVLLVINSILGDAVKSTVIDFLRVNIIFRFSNSSITISTRLLQEAEQVIYDSNNGGFGDADIDNERYHLEVDTGRISFKNVDYQGYYYYGLNDNEKKIWNEEVYLYVNQPGLVNPYSETINIDHGNIEVNPEFLLPSTDGVPNLEVLTNVSGVPSWYPMLGVALFPDIRFIDVPNKAEVRIRNIKFSLNYLQPGIISFENFRFILYREVHAGNIDGWYYDDLVPLEVHGTVTADQLLPYPIEGDLVLDMGADAIDHPHLNDNQYRFSYKVAMNEDKDLMTFSLQCLDDMAEGNYSSGRFRVESCSYVAPTDTSIPLRLFDLIQDQNLKGYELRLDDVLNTMDTFDLQPDFNGQYIIIDFDEPWHLLFRIEFYDDGSQFNMIEIIRAGPGTGSFVVYDGDYRGYATEDYEDNYVKYDSTSHKLLFKNTLFQYTGNGITPRSDGVLFQKSVFFYKVPVLPPIYLKDLVSTQDISHYSLMGNSLRAIMDSIRSDVYKTVTIHFDDFILTFDITETRNEIYYAGGDPSTEGSIYIEETPEFWADDFEDDNIRWFHNERRLYIKQADFMSVSYSGFDGEPDHQIQFGYVEFNPNIMLLDGD